jgi:hypothetical protein
VKATAGAFGAPSKVGSRSAVWSGRFAGSWRTGGADAVRDAPTAAAAKAATSEQASATGSRRRYLRRESGINLGGTKTILASPRRPRL